MNYNYFLSEEGSRARGEIGVWKWYQEAGGSFRSSIDGSGPRVVVVVVKCDSMVEEKPIEADIVGGSD